MSAKGVVSFVFFYRLAGGLAAPVWFTLGKYPDMSLNQAREKRDECRAWLADVIRVFRLRFRLRNA
ncbi:Arm DNA-binding domain-containing protein [Leclercia sp. TB492]|uniref:Arm DNA-binding domain-containing protein n=1 Tax=Leclercia sp. TB492 TaxID=3412682 RepID=UPI003CF558A8